MCANDKIREKTEALAKLLNTNTYSKANLILQQNLQPGVKTYNIDIKSDSHPLPLKREDVFLATHLSIYYRNSNAEFSSAGGTNMPLSWYHEGDVRIQQSEQILLKSLSLHEFYYKDMVTDSGSGISLYNFDLNKIKKELLPYIVFSGVRSVDIILNFLDTSGFNLGDTIVFNFEGIIYPSKADYLASIEK